MKRKHSRALAAGIFIFALLMMTGVSAHVPRAETVGTEMVLVPGGSFIMGDSFGDGAENERPLHPVDLRDFYIAPREVTVAEFRAFTHMTGYETSAEGRKDSIEHAKITVRFRGGEIAPDESLELYARLLQLGGAARWLTDKPIWDLDPMIDWRDPGFPQEEDHPVVCVSWDDAIRYCNWLSEKEGIPPAYDTAGGRLLDAHGEPTSEIGEVRGYRLPTEAEWEYAAREGGRDVRFGTGKNIARAAEIVYRADAAEQDYAESGEYRRRTAPAGSLAPNALGLHEMSGNAWEWVHDSFAPYTSGPQIDPRVEDGTHRILRGGRWGGDANECRVFHRSGWLRNDRCNNSGFRIARSG